MARTFWLMLLAIFGWIGAEIRGTRGELVEIGKSMAAATGQLVTHEKILNQHDGRLRYLERNKP